MCNLQLKNFLESEIAVDRVRKALVKTSDVDRFLLLARIEVNKNERIQKCTPSSVLSCLVRAAQLGLFLSTQDVYLVPYRDTCTMQLGYQGMLKLLYRSGMTSLKANAVYANDRFEYMDGTESKIFHVRSFGDRGEFQCVYAIALIHGTQLIEIMDKKEIDFIRSKSRDPNSMPWRDFYDEMAKKTVIRRLFKTLPQENFDPSVLEIMRSDDHMPITNDNPANTMDSFAESERATATL
jgi:recombination protein RecT